MAVQIKQKELNPRILDDFKWKIIEYFREKNYTNPTMLTELQRRMNAKQKLYVENLVEQDIGRMVNKQDRNYISIDQQFCKKDLNGTIKLDANQRRVITSQLIHELMHSASRKERSGIRVLCDVSNNMDDIKNPLALKAYFESKKQGKKYSYDINVGLDEGITQMMAEKIVGYTLSPQIDSYADLKKYAKILDTTFGESIMYDSYFFKSGELEQACFEHTKDNSFWATFNRTLDTNFHVISASRNPNISEHCRQSFEWLNGISRKYIIRYFAVNIIVPQLKKLTIEEQRKYINNIQNCMSDDQSFVTELNTQVQQLWMMDEKSFAREKSSAQANIAALNDVILGYVKCMNDPSELSKLTTSEPGHISIRPSGNSKNSYKIAKDSPLEEALLARKAELYNKDLRYNHLKFDNPDLSQQQLSERVNAQYSYDFNQIISQVLGTSTVDFNGMNLAQKRSKFACIKVALVNRGYIVPNKLSECENVNSLRLDIRQKQQTPLQDPADDIFR